MAAVKKHPVLVAFTARDSAKHPYRDYTPGGFYRGPHAARYMVANKFRPALIGPAVDEEPEKKSSGVDDSTEET